jgi:hypothetical protein
VVGQTQSARDAYQFLCSREGQIVSNQQVSNATNGAWSPGTAGNYRSKKWKNLTEKVGPALFRVNGISLLTEDEFVALQSQVTEAVASSQAEIVRDSIGAGEGQKIEFKSRIPKNATRLAEEIAAFSSMNDGVILIGVTDSGAVVGYEDTRERIEGIVRNVSPVPTVAVDLVPYQTKTVALVRVLKGDEPVYYAADRPYIRQGSLSRPATPDEVKGRVDRFLRQGRSFQQDTVSFGPTQLDLAVDLPVPVELAHVQWQFAPTNNVRGEFVSPTQLRFVRRSKSDPSEITYWITDRRQR